MDHIVQLNQEIASRKLRAGFSLIETMIGMFVLSMVLLACIAAMPEIDTIAERTECLSEGFTHLNGSIELYRTMEFDAMAGLIDDSGTSGNNRGALAGSFNGEQVYYSQSTESNNSVSYTIDHYLQYGDNSDGTENTTLIKATIVVQWTFDKQPQSISSYAIFSKNGLSDKKFSVAN